MKRLILLYGFVCVLLGQGNAQAQVNARMLQYPDVSQTHITFVYAGDIWVVSKEGGTASRLSSPKGEETFPRFSPDGSRIAFSGNYDGNTDIYTIPTLGGTPERITHHPSGERIVDWYPDGESLLFASAMKSAPPRYNQFYQVAAEGGFPEQLPLQFAEFGSFSPDGSKIAFQIHSRAFRNWKRYRGGRTPDIWIFDFEDQSARNITNHPANDSQPMWIGNTIYFLSDRDELMRYNLWAYDTETEDTRQLTFFEEFDVHFPAAGAGDIIFEAGGKLYLFKTASQEYHQVRVDVVTDHITLKPRNENVGEMIRYAGISPHGKRAVFAARGEIFTVPAEHGVIRNLSRNSGTAERYPVWSPDGKYIAHFTDATGDYELALAAAEGSQEPEVVSSFGAGYRYPVHWAPDSRQVAYIDQTQTIQVYDIESRQTTVVDSTRWLSHGGKQGFTLNWSADSRWLTYTRTVANQYNAVFLYDTESAATHQVTAGFYDDARPVFDPDGQYLYYLTNRTLSPTYSDLDGSWVYINTTKIAAVPLRTDVPDPLEPRNDEVEIEEEEAENGEKQSDTEEEEPEPVEIDLVGFEQRAVLLPPDAGNYTDVQAVSGKVLYRRMPRSGSKEEKAAIVSYDIEEREEEVILGDADVFILAAGGEKILARSSGKWGIIDVAPDQTIEKPLRTGELAMTVDPQAEWQQLFTDAWRLMRDFFYDPNMHGVDWQQMRRQYGEILADAVTRWDVNYVIGELIAELNASHTYRGGGDMESPESRGVGLLGADYEIDDGYYRFKRIIEGAPWDLEDRSPLLKAGIKPGEYLLAVNGVPVDIDKDPWAAFQGLAGKTVSLTIHDRPSKDGAREVLVETLSSESSLRNLAWIEGNRKRVEEATNGRVGYVYVPNTGTSGQTELVRQFRAQFNKDGLIFDERFNAGGQYPDRFIELMNRPRTSYIGYRYSKPFPYSPLSRTGPQVMLINAWAGSGGDLFPYLFRQAGLGPLIGTRTWGGLIGISGTPPLIDGGGITTPNLALYGLDGKWLIEGHGVEPDIQVPEDPGQMVKKQDPQLEKAIREVGRLLKENPPEFIPRPEFEDRTAKGVR